MRHTRAELPKQLFVVQRSSRCVETALTHEAYEDAPAHARVFIGVSVCLSVRFGLRSWSKPKSTLIAVAMDLPTVLSKLLSE